VISDERNLTKIQNLKFSCNYIPPNTDLNSITTPGFYYNAVNDYASTMPNIPQSYENAFGMIVYEASGIIQEWTNFQADTKYMRRLYGEWSQWRKIYPFTASALDIVGLPEVGTSSSPYDMFLMRYWE